MFPKNLLDTKTFRWIWVIGLLLSLLFGNLGAALADGGQPGAVYVQRNQANGNAIAIYQRSTEGSLALSAMVPTGGLGAGAGLGSQGSVILSGDGRWLLAVNAGSNDISVFRDEVNGLTLMDKAASGGVRPISLALYKNLLYVLNAGDPGNIAGFVLDQNGKLAPLVNSTRPLSNNGVGAAPGPAQISFNKDGSMLVVN